MSDVAATIERLAERLGAGLRAQHLTLATAESCTAGGLGYAVTLVPGSSQWYDRGFITYSNESKMQVLGVSAAYLRDFGAVSEPVARAMAIGALSQSAAQVALAVTGIAGPDDGHASLRRQSRGGAHAHDHHGTADPRGTAEATTGRVARAPGWCAGALRSRIR
jgi:PncC family amidohydrolase